MLCNKLDRSFHRQWRMVQQISSKNSPSTLFRHRCIENATSDGFISWCFCGGRNVSCFHRFFGIYSFHHLRRIRGGFDEEALFRHCHFDFLQAIRLCLCSRFGTKRRVMNMGDPRLCILLRVHPCLAPLFRDSNPHPPQCLLTPLMSHVLPSWLWRCSSPSSTPKPLVPSTSGTNRAAQTC
ncbi:MAG: hypothetical protein BYD32DRAFT_155729 [Podila humilis]|nr:MAG: hypothetical protein BYD32DRAFT_155729 [Podila humilis]